MCVILILLGILIFMQGSDLNPLFQIDPYLNWFNQKIFPSNLYFVWMTGTIFLGILTFAFGLNLWKKQFDEPE